MRARGFLIAVVVFAMTAGLASSALAKKPAEDPARYRVEIAGAGAIATTCTQTMEVIRTNTRGGATSHFESGGATLDVLASGLSGNGYEVAPGCHGSLAPLEYFRITLEDDGSVAMLWIFDVDERTTIVTLRNGKEKVSTYRVDFRMGGPYDSEGDFAVWDRTVDTVGDKEVIRLEGTGQFTFVHYDSGGHTEVDGSPVFVDVGAPTFALDITLTEM